MNKHIGLILIIGLLSLSSIIVNTACGDSIELTSTGITLYVGGSGPGNYSTIQSAINAAQDGDTVFVYDDSSPYYEHNIQIRKSLHLIGEGKETTIIDGEQMDSVIYIYADNVKLKGFTIQYGLPSNVNSYRSSNIEISDNIITSSQIYGIDCHESQDIKISENIILNNGLGVSLSRLSGINVIESNNIKSNNCGLSVSGYNSNKLTIKKNNFICNIRSVNINIDEKIIFKNNYWNRPRILPKIILGIYTHCDGHKTFGLSFDWHPAKEPYVI